MTTSYITPITDRTRDDVDYARNHQNDLVNKHKGAWNYTDCNRVCNNLKYAAEYMYEEGFLLSPYSMQIKTDWTETDIITIEQINSMIINNMNYLKTYSRTDLPWNYISSVVNMDYNVANWIERNIHNLATQELPPPATYRLTVNHGSGSGDYEARTAVTITADAPQQGYVFDYWSGDHLENITNPRQPQTTYIMPLQDITLTANYTNAIPHTLTIITNSGTETVSLSMGQTKRIEADPAPMNKVFHHWDVNPSQYERNLYEPAATTTFTMPNETVTLTAVYITKGEKQLVVKNGNGSGYYEYGTYAYVSSSKPANAVFTNWTGATQYLTGPATQEYNSVQIPDVARIEIEAHWTVPPVTNVSLTVVNGYITSTGQTTGTFTEGDRVAITAGPIPSGQTVGEWTKTGGGNLLNATSSTVTAEIGQTAMTVTANYRNLEYHTLTVTTNSGTTVTTKERYEEFIIDANPAPEGYVFDKWTGDTSGITTTWARTGATMGASDRTIVANYRALNPHTLTVHQLSGDVTYTKAEGETQRVIAETAPTGQEFKDWTLTGVGGMSAFNYYNIVYTFRNGDGELTPNYVNVWTINVVNGTIDVPAGTSKILRQGESYRLQCRSLAVYERFDGWTITGPGTVNNSAAPSTRFVVGAGDATITANISQYPDKTLTVYQQDPDTGTNTLVSQRTYTYGSRIEIVAPVAPNQTTFSSWTGDVDMVSPSALASTITVENLTKDTTLIATYYYPDSPDYYTLTVYNGTPQSQLVAVGDQQTVIANLPQQGWEFCTWMGDTQYLVNQDLTQSENAVIMPNHAITLRAKYNKIGELPLFEINVTNGIASGTYITGEDTEDEETHNVSGTNIQVPPGTEVTLTANTPVTGYTFNVWYGNFVAAGVSDIDVTRIDPTFTSTAADLEIEAQYRELNTCTVYATNANGYANVRPDTYDIAGNLQNTENIHYTFTGWTCVDIHGTSQIQKIAYPDSESTTITLAENDVLYIEAHYIANYKLTIVGGQDTGDHYYYEGEIVNSVYANTPTTGTQFDSWTDPVGIITTNIYDKTPTIKMKDSPATLTANFISTDALGNSVLVTGNDIHNEIIYRRSTSLVNGIFAIGALTFDRDGCIGTITEVDPDHSDDTDDYRVQKLFYGGNF